MPIGVIAVAATIVSLLLGVTMWFVCKIIKMKSKGDYQTEAASQSQNDRKSELQNLDNVYVTQTNDIEIQPEL